MKATLLPALLIPALANAQLAITEINSNGTPADFWELTNGGTTAIDLSGYRWTDSAGAFFVSVPSGTTIAPGESIVFVTGTDAASFRSAWGLTAQVKLIASADPGLGQNDSVRLFASPTAATPVLSLSYAYGGFVRSNGTSSLGGHAGPSAGATGTHQSLILDPNYGFSSRRYTFATGGNFSTWQAPGGSAIGSPGAIGTPAINNAPYFTGETRTFWATAKDLAYSTFRVQALDSDPGQTVTLSIIHKPAWLTLVPEGATRFRLSGTPSAAQAGDHSFTIRATDNAPGSPLATDKTFTLTVFPPSSPLLVNEYNAVGTADRLDPLAAGNDTFFGSKIGNGGDWFELVVAGTGSASSTVDLRGWSILIQSGGETDTLVLSNDPYWARVTAGTLVTFIENDTARGGLDTSIHKRSSRHTAGHLWSNIWVHDPVFIDQKNSSFGSGINIDNNQTWISLRSPDGSIVLGPFGEGVAMEDSDSNGYPDTPVNVSSEEVLALRDNPSPLINPLFANYADQPLSTFGSPNVWREGTKAQSFASYLAQNTPPVFTSNPTKHALDSYSYTITCTDPNGTAPAVSCPSLPSFLTFTPAANGGTITQNRPLTTADSGQHPIRIEATDGQFITPQAFILTTFNPAPTVMVNEFNAVEATGFLNGGTQGADSDAGPAAADTHFGRIEGNGGDWLELVVTGGGQPGTVDLRGWRIEICQGPGPSTRPSSILMLSGHPYWAAVPTGTILTFIERNTAQGGLDTGIRIRDRRATHGDMWTNVWIGDTELLTYQDQPTNGYDIIGGVVSGIALDHQDTHIRLINASGHVIHGPVGEGISPVSGIDPTRVFALQADPLPSVSPLNTSYVGSADASSFGAPNPWNGTIQSFTRYVHVPTPYELWINGHALADRSPAGDPDGDGRSNRSEYVFGGDPSKADAPPEAQTIRHTNGSLIWTYLRRAGDASLKVRHEHSLDLTDWREIPEAAVAEMPHPVLTGMERVTVSLPQGSAARQGYFRAAAP